jgi:hypothetical protein
MPTLEIPTRSLMEFDSVGDGLGRGDVLEMRGGDKGAFRGEAGGWEGGGGRLSALVSDPFAAWGAGAGGRGAGGGGGDASKKGRFASLADGMSLSASFDMVFFFFADSRMARVCLLPL